MCVDALKDIIQSSSAAKLLYVRLSSVVGAEADLGMFSMFG